MPRVPDSQLPSDWDADPRERLTLPPYVTARGATVLCRTRTRAEYVDCLEWCRAQGEVRERGATGFWWEDPDTPRLTWSIQPPSSIEDEEFTNEPALRARYLGR